MKSLVVTAPGVLETIEIATPEIGPGDILVRMKACGICGADPHARDEGHIVPGAPQSHLGHEPAGEVAVVGAEVANVKVGDRVVFDPTKVSDAIVGGGGPQGALSEFVAVRGAVAGFNFMVFPDTVPWHVAALSEPIAVARRAVDRTHPQPEHKVIIFGAGPVGLGALLAFRHYGVAHIVVADVQTNRLETALQLGATAVINSAEEEVRARLVELHGEGTDAFHRPGLPDTDIYLDAAGVPSVAEIVFAGPKLGAVYGIVAIHRKPLVMDSQMLIPSELTIVHSMGHPEEMFAVTQDIIEHTEEYARIVSDLVPFENAAEAIDLASRPGATSKVVVTF